MGSTTVEAAGSSLEQVLKVSEQMLKEAPERCDKLIGRWLGESARYAQV